MKHHSAIVGFGDMGSWHHSSITEKVEEISVKGIFDVRDEINQKAEKLNLHIYKSLDEIIDDKEIDIVTIATPNDFHKGIAIKLLEGGKNVICEKPVTLNAPELEEIIAVSQKTGKLFAVHQNRRWDRDFCIIKKILADNTLGEPYFIESKVMGSRGSMAGWRGYKQNGGGMLLDWGVHLIDQMLMLIDSPVVELNAHLLKLFSPEVDDNIKFMMRFENGVSALLEMSTNCFYNQPRWHMSCMDGTVVIHDFDCKGSMYQKKTDDDDAWVDAIVYTEAGPTKTMAPRPKQTITETALPEVKTDWSDYYKNIVDVIDNGAELIVKPEQSLRAMKIIDLLFEANDKKCGVSCRI